MATLYTLAAVNSRRTWILVTVFLVLIIALGWLFSYLFDNQAILIFAVALSIIQSFASYWYSDKIVLALTGAIPIEKENNPELYRLVENLCITAGLPLPKIYILDEDQPNAFATGRDSKHAAIAVTRGILQKLDKTELEGVIAHELSHVGNRDTLLSTVIVVLVGIVSLLSNMFLRMGRISSGNRRRDDNQAAGVLVILGFVGALLAPVVATLIQLAISRKREFLADADGALLTRYPEGLARALQKIASDPAPMRRLNNTVSHLYISNPFRQGGFVANLFSTHPPVEARIKALLELKID